MVGHFKVWKENWPHVEIIILYVSDIQAKTDNQSLKYLNVYFLGYGWLCKTYYGWEYSVSFMMKQFRIFGMRILWVEYIQTLIWQLAKYVETVQSSKIFVLINAFSFKNCEKFQYFVSQVNQYHVCPYQPFHLGWEKETPNKSTLL